AQGRRCLSARLSGNGRSANCCGSRSHRNPSGRRWRASFRRMTPAEAASLKPLRIRVVTVRPGENISTLAARMMGKDRKLDLF
ncbi:hypothetical protein AB9F39_37655, partial [Rhizobium leguminosarum]